MNDAQFDSVANAALEAIRRQGVTTFLDAAATPRTLAAFAAAQRQQELTARAHFVNRHAAAKEIWVAARSGGFHYRWDGAAWKDTRDGTAVFGSLSKLVSAQSGSPVRLSPAS